MYASIHPATEPLTGDKLLSFVDSYQAKTLTKWDLVVNAGHVKPTDSGEGPNFISFYEALLEAKNDARERAAAIKRLSRTPLTLNAPSGAVPITMEQWQAFIGPYYQDQSFDIKTVGPWCIPISCKALAVSYTWSNGFTDTITLHGKRSLQKPRQESYHLAGSVSINGKKVRGFTSSQLFKLPDGRLLDVAVIHACVKKA